MDASYRIPECNLWTLNAKVDALNKVALKLHIEPITIRETGEDFTQVLRCRKQDHAGCLHSMRPVSSTDSDFKTVRWVTLDISGAAPKLEGWTFLATITHEDAGNTIRRVPGTEEWPIPESYRTSAPKCDHCHTNRSRKDTYLVTDGKMLAEVGHQCVRDFLGHHDPHTIAAFLEALSALEHELGAEPDEERMHSEAEYYFTADYLPHVAAMIRTHGWVSGGHAREWGRESTAAQAWMNFYETIHPSTHKDERNNPVVPTADDIALAQATLDWARTDLAAKLDKSDYEHNLSVLLANETITNRNMGTVASGITAYQRAKELLAKREVTVKIESKFVGNIGDKLSLNLTVERTREFPNDFGPRGGVTTAVTFRDESGNKFVWFATGCHDFPAGTTYAVKGTVKNHKDNGQYGKETILTRCKVAGEVVLLASEVHARETAIQDMAEQKARESYQHRERGLAYDNGFKRTLYAAAR